MCYFVDKICFPEAYISLNHVFSVSSQKISLAIITDKESVKKDVAFNFSIFRLKSHLPSTQI